MMDVEVNCEWSMVLNEDVLDLDQYKHDNKVFKRRLWMLVTFDYKPFEVTLRENS